MTTTFTSLQLFCGIGGGALGFQAARVEAQGLRGRFRTLAGIDCDAEACADFERLTGAKAALLDLFSREDYVAFHGKEPPPGWCEVQPAEILAACGGVHPDVVFLSPPCKGFSGLLPKARALSEKYQALNRLTVRGLWYTLEAFGVKDKRGVKKLPKVILLENVPRITTRGKPLLAQLRGMLESYGYLVTFESHCCGEIGGLGQRRKRFLLIARQPEQVPALIYRPPVRGLRTIGDVIGPMPMPDDPASGPMHRLPRLKARTWLRLALIPAGGDWRDLQKIAPEEYRLQWVPRGGGCYGVQRMDEPAATVTANPTVKGSNAASVADHRLGSTPRAGAYQVVRWEEPSPTVVAAGRVSRSNGASVVADPRTGADKASPKNRHHAQLRVCPMDATAGTITGAQHVGGGAQSVADDRTIFNGAQRVQPFDRPGGTVTGSGPHGQSGNVADPRLDRFGGSPGLYGVNDFDQPAPTITGGARVSSSNCPSAIADPRLTPKSPKFNHAFKVSEFDEPSPTVAGSTTPSSGAISIADVRLGCTQRNASYGVQDWGKEAHTVSGALDVHSGPGAVADERFLCPDFPELDTQPDPPPLIISLDGTRHRPLTTLELARLQSFPLTFPDGAPLKLAGGSDTRWRGRIGNAVPPDAARAMAEQILPALLAGTEGKFTMQPTGVWVKPETDCEESERRDVQTQVGLQ